MVLTHITDVRLRAALADSAASAQPINVLVKMQPMKAAADAATQAKEVVRRVAEKLKVEPKFQYRKLDDTLQVFAPPKFVRLLVEQPEVLTAYSPAEHQSAMITPVKSEPVDITAVDREMKSSRKVIGRASRTPKPRS